jgi:hypothetical protein
MRGPFFFQVLNMGFKVADMLASVLVLAMHVNKLFFESGDFQHFFYHKVFAQFRPRFASVMHYIPAFSACCSRRSIAFIILRARLAMCRASMSNAEYPITVSSVPSSPPNAITTFWPLRPITQLISPPP